MASRTSFVGSISFRIVVIALLAVVLLIPVGMVTALVRERQQRSNEAIAEVTSKWAGIQTIGGPVLTVPYSTHWKDAKGEEYTRTEYMQLLPESLKVEGKLDPFSRSRGIYKVILYNVRLTCSGVFSLAGLAGRGVPDGDIVWRDAFVSIGIPDMRGINEAITMLWNGRPLQLEPGVRSGCDVFKSGVSVPVTGEQDSGRAEFSFTLDLNGSGALNFLPFGKTTVVEIMSAWPNPSFDGAFLPKTRRVDIKGFSAMWRILDFNRNYPQQWVSTSNSPNVDGSRFGVRLFAPVDQYTQTTRAVKYAVMFIGLTFLIFFMVEVFNKRRIHPIQYVLVGLALCLFYILLLSLSEHLTFAAAYLIAGLSNLALITFYAGSALKNRAATAITAITLGGLYGFMYVLLRDKDYALLIGSIGLFVIMAAIMLLTRKVDWYGLEVRANAPANGPLDEPAGLTGPPAGNSPE